MLLCEIGGAVHVIEGVSMPTAILIVHTTDGFVAASDGQGTKTDKNGDKLYSYHHKKIFEAKGPSLHLMYGVSGAASIPQNGTEVLQPAFRQVIDDLVGQAWLNLGSYADAVILKLVGVLRQEIQKENGQLPDSYIARDNPISFHIQFSGYCNQLPVMTERECQLWADKWSVTTSEPLCVSKPGKYSHVGSGKVFCKLAVLEDEGFSSYKTTEFRKIIRESSNITREEFVKAATKYIQACMTKEARALDTVCDSIGGDIQVATLSPDGVFSLRLEIPHKG